MRLVLAGTTLAAIAAAPASAFAVDYLSLEQAVQLMFPEADRFDAREITLDVAQLQALDAQGIRGRSARWTARIARRGDATLGVVVADAVIGKFELISYAVGIDGEGAIRQVEMPAGLVRHVARIPQRIAALDQRATPRGMAQRPVFVEPRDMADLPEHRIDDFPVGAHQFGR